MRRVCTALLWAALLFNTCYGQYNLLNTDPSAVDTTTKIRQCMVVGFDGKHAVITGRDAVNPSITKLGQDIAANGLGGVILYGRNIEVKQQVINLSAFLQQSSTQAPLLIGVDQEGGQVQRLKLEHNFNNYDSAASVAFRTNGVVAKTYYSHMAQELAEAGINWNFGPVVDVNPTDGVPCPVIGGKDRSYGSKPKIVTSYASAFVEGHRENGVHTALKHFPGHGSAKGDTHKGMTDVTDVWDAERELQPYKDMIATGHVDSIMTSHIFHRGIDPKNPASLSPEFIQKKLRGKMGYDGLVVSDDLCMGAILEHYKAIPDNPDSVYNALAQAGIQALKAGSDMIMFSYNNAASNGLNVEMPDTVERFVTSATKAVEDGTLSEKRLNEAFSRVMAFKKKLVKPVGIDAKLD